MSRLVSVATMLVALASPAAAQTRAPYLQLGTPDSMVVAWRTASASPSSVCYGASPDALTSRAEVAGTRTDHAVTVTGLSADTRYYYAVGSSACPPATSGDTNQYFRTAPAPGGRRPFRFWVVGDSGTGGTRQQQVTDAMLAYVGAMRPDIYLQMGDMAYSDGTTSEFDDNFFAMYEPILENTVCWPTMGNHEGHTSDSASESGPYYEAYVLPTMAEAGGMASGTEAYYSFDYANVHFVVLESYEVSRAVGGAMLTWLEEDLAATDQEWLIAFWHHPPYTKGSHNSDTEGNLVDMRENALPILEAHGVDVVLGGHSHIYERSYLVHGAYDTPTTAGGHIVDMGDGRLDGDGPYDTAGDGALYVVAGHGGAGVGGPADHPLMYFSEVANGSCIVDVNGGMLTLRNIRWDGTETDYVTLAKSDGLYLTSPIGGEVFLAGSTVDVTWSSTGGTATNVRLEFSLDAGAHWAPIAASTEDDGLFAWTTPENVTTEARVRITDLDDATRTAESGNFELSSRSNVDVITFGGMWEYHDEGVDQGMAWRTEYGGWGSGSAQLGYGEGDEATTLRNEDPNIPTVYFRTQINLAGAVTAARLRVLFDDAIAVYVNGTEVLTRNIGDPAFAAYAAGGSSDNETAEEMLDFSGGSPFVVGDNVVAAIVKQSSSGSSDLSFDLALSVETTVSDLDPIPWPPVPAGTDGGGIPGVDGGGVPGTDGGGVGREGGPGGDPGDGSASGGCGCRAASGPTSVGWITVSLAILASFRRRRRP